MNRASKRMNTTSIPKPFHYKFVKEKDPQTVEIPTIEKDDDSADEKKETYGSYFKDAHLVFPSVCPKGGSWKGYFENVLSGPARTRDKKSTTRVEETFYLFFNSKPPPDAESSFDAVLESETTSKVHVRGMGTNLFGTFEISGWLDISTKILHCQRSYLPVQKLKRTTSKSTERKYFTRKKIMSWQRPTDSDEEKPQLMRGLSGGKKRHRSVSTSSVTLENKEETQENAPVAAPSPVPKAPEPTPVKSTQMIQTPKKKKEKSQQKSIHLPLVADNMEARWRSAHYIFYQRITNPSDDATSATTTTTTCVYEGQFLNGYGMREGYGVCLYPNGNIYEGGFRRNKESGFGTLYSGDRKKIFYTGDWDRGKMHGRGKYYYYYTDCQSFLESSSNVSTTPSNTTLPPSLLRHAKKHQKNQDLNQIVIGVYQGDFKENVRQGYGTYTLPDGSTYEGEFQNNIFSGKGTFTWPDGSLYTGSWKDGKRHGQGLLKTYDGFTYEGTWSNNAMDGRGTCVYPDEQRYEGLFVLGKKEGRGTIRFTNGAIYEGRFKDDSMEGQGTMKMSMNVGVGSEDWMIPIEFQSDMEHIHQKAGFDHAGS